MDEFWAWCFGVICGFVGSIALLAPLTTPTSVWHKEAIDRGYAQFDSITGEWQWIEPASKAKQ
jgi:hypothetical protein